jgi:hypothetical protein
MDYSQRIEEELGMLRAKHSRPPGPGHSVVSHQHLGFCSACVEGVDGVYHELSGWRLLGLLEGPISATPDSTRSGA